MTIFMRNLLVAMSSVILSGCSLLSPVKSEPENTYVLTSIPAYTVARRTHPITLLVMPPDTNPAYNTTQMAYTVKPYQIAYFAQNRWAETPSQMLQPLMVQTLQNTRYFHAVVTPPYAGRYQYMLSTHILKLQQDYTRRPAVLQLTLRAQLSRVTTNQIMATKQFSVVEPLWQKSPYGGVIAANRATATMLKHLSDFCLENVARRE